MSNSEIKQLFEFSRFRNSDAKIILSILYLPVGIVLIALRAVCVLCFLLSGQILPDSPFTEKLLGKLASLSFGITVSVNNPKQIEKVDFYISNNASIFDRLVVHTVTGSVSHSKSFNLPGLGAKDFGSLSNLDSFKKNVETLATKKRIPVHLCPEERPTNGKALLKFNPKCFQLFVKVQPVCIVVERPGLNLSVSTVGSSHLTDILYFMYSPITVYKLTFLPSLEKKSLTDDEFAEIARQNIASELKIELSNFTSADLAEWEKQYLSEQRRRAQVTPPSRAQNPALLRMVSQVKEVLPHVPLNVIYGDLVITRSVDATITNILEGRLQFVPEPLQASSSTSNRASTSSSKSTSPSLKQQCSVTSSPLLITAATSFGKTAGERTKSFQERKEQLIAAARRRYIEKHNLDLAF